MRALRTFFALVFFLLLGLQSAQSQSTSYKTAIGLRLGYPLSVSLKHFINEKGAIEAFAGARGYSFYRWYNVGAAYQHHSAIDGVEGLRWYVGGGASAFFWSFDDGFFNDNASNTSLGILAVGGLDYKFADYPINLSVDWMPVFFVNGYGNGFGGGYGALSARYTFK
jgi:hypothetical protein